MQAFEIASTRLQTLIKQKQPKQIQYAVPILRVAPSIANNTILITVSTPFYSYIIPSFGSFVKSFFIYFFFFSSGFAPSSLHLILYHLRNQKSTKSFGKMCGSTFCTKKLSKFGKAAQFSKSPRSRMRTRRSNRQEFSKSFISFFFCIKEACAYIIISLNLVLIGFLHFS